MDFPGALRTRASTGGITKETRRSVGPPREEMKRKRAPRLLCTCVRCRTGKIKCERHRRKEVEERATGGYSLGGSGTMLEVAVLDLVPISTSLSPLMPCLSFLVVLALGVVWKQGPEGWKCVLLTRNAAPSDDCRYFAHCGQGVPSSRPP